MLTKQERKKFFLELVEWSSKKDSYSIEEFNKEKDIDYQQLKFLTNEEDSCYKAIGKASAQCLENAHNAWKSKKISSEIFSKYLKEYGFNIDAESYDRLPEFKI